MAAGSYTDAAHNAGTAGASPILSIDTLAPTVTLTGDRLGVGTSQTAAITLRFSEDPGTSIAWNNVTQTGDLNVTGGTLGPLTGTGLTRVVTFTPLPNFNGSAGVSVPGASYADGFGNAGSASAALAIGI